MVATGASNSYGQIDSLAYAYDGNQLRAVDDAASNPDASLAGDFNDNGVKKLPNPSEFEYFYDDNGNMTKDENKGIESISYNHLNLPEVITFNPEGTKRIEYVYDAAGIKLQKKIYDQTTEPVKITDYIGQYVYQTTDSRLLAFIHAPEGRILPQSDSLGSLTGYSYEYHYKDHLGNLRLAFQTENKWELTAEPENEAEEQQLFSGLVNTLSAEKARTGTRSVRLDNGVSISTTAAIPVEQGKTYTIKLYANQDTASGSSSRFAAVQQPSSNPLDNFNMTAPLISTGNFQVGERSQQQIQVNVLGVLSALKVKKKKSLKPTTYQEPVYSVRSIEEETLPTLTLKVFDSLGTEFKTETVNIVAGADCSWLATGLTLDAESDSVPQGGSFQIFVENFGDDPVWIDDLVIREFSVSQENHYFPFGMNLTGIEKQGSPDHKFQYVGVEKDEMSGFYETDFRRYDSQLGRMTGVDAMADQFISITPYQYSFNNPIVLKDPSGLAPSYVYENGKYYKEKKNDKKKEVSWNTVQKHISKNSTNIYKKGTVYVNFEGSSLNKQGQDEVITHTQKIFDDNGIKSINVERTKLPYDSWFFEDLIEKIGLADSYIEFTSEKISDGEFGITKYSSKPPYKVDDVSYVSTFTVDSYDLEASTMTRFYGLTIAHEVGHRLLMRAYAHSNVPGSDKTGHFNETENIMMSGKKMSSSLLKYKLQHKVPQGIYNLWQHEKFLPKHITIINEFLKKYGN